MPREDIVRLIETARYAPSGHNDQPVRWLVLDDRDELRRLAEIGADWMRWMLDNELPVRYEVGIGKVFADEMGQRLFILGLQIMGTYPRLNEDPKWDSFRKKLIHWYHFGVGHTLAGGTSEIMRWVIARLILKE